METAATQPSLIMQLVPFILIAVIFYFLLIRPQSKQMKETQKMLDALKPGDKILTRGGMIGTISSIREKEVDVEVAKNVKISFARTAISSVLK